MIENSRILAEIVARKEANLVELEKHPLPPELEALVTQFKNQNDEQMIASMAEELIPNFKFGVETQFQGFEWYYDGYEYPFVTGYNGPSCSSSTGITDLAVGSDTWQARIDFETGIVPASYANTDTGYFDINIVCKPYFDLICSQSDQYLQVLSDEHYDDIKEIVGSLFSLKTYEILHKAMHQIVTDDRLDKTNMKSPFYVFANNHDWSQFLIFVI